MNYGRRRTGGEIVTDTRIFAEVAASFEDDGLVTTLNAAGRGVSFRLTAEAHSRLHKYWDFMASLGFGDDLRRARKKGDAATEADLLRFEAEIKRRWPVDAAAVRKAYARAKSKKRSPYEELVSG